MLAALLLLLAQEPANPPVPEAESGPKTGLFTTRLERLHPKGKRTEVLGRLGFSLKVVREQDPADGLIEMSEQTFRVRVPHSYDSKQPAGLLVWIHGSAMGKVPREWDSALDAANLIAIAPNGAGDSTLVWRRAGLALASVEGIAKRYSVDPERVYVAGVGVAARMAARMALAWPDVFQGAICISDVAYFEPHGDPDRPGHIWPARMKKPAPSLLRQARSRSRFVFLAGSNDKYQARCRALALRMVGDDEFRHVNYFEVRSLVDRTPEVAWFRRAIESLDSPLDR